MHAASEARKVTFEHEVIEESSLRTQLCHVMLDVEWLQGLELTAHSGSIEGVVIKKSFSALAVAM